MSDDYSFAPKTPMRPNTLYTSWRLHKALGYVARKTGQSREDLAEMIIGDWLAKAHPEIVAWVQKRELDEHEFVKKLKPIPFTEAREKTEKFQATTEDQLS